MCITGWCMVASTIWEMQSPAEFSGCIVRVYSCANTKFVVANVRFTATTSRAAAKKKKKGWGWGRPFRSDRVNLPPSTKMLPVLAATNTHCKRSDARLWATGRYGSNKHALQKIRLEALGHGSFWQQLTRTAKDQTWGFGPQVVSAAISDEFCSCKNKQNKTKKRQCNCCEVFLVTVKLSPVFVTAEESLCC